MTRTWSPDQAIKDVGEVGRLVPHIRDRLCAMSGDPDYEPSPDDLEQVVLLISKALVFLANTMPPEGSFLWESPHDET